MDYIKNVKNFVLASLVVGAVSCSGAKYMSNPHKNTDYKDYSALVFNNSTNTNDIIFEGDSIDFKVDANSAVLTVKTEDGTLFKIYDNKGHDLKFDYFTLEMRNGGKTYSYSKHMFSELSRVNDFSVQGVLDSYVDLIKQAKKAKD